MIRILAKPRNSGWTRYVIDLAVMNALLGKRTLIACLPENRKAIKARITNKSVKVQIVKAGISVCPK